MPGRSVADPGRGHESLVGVRRRHPDVEHDHVGPVQVGLAEHRVEVVRLADDLASGLGQQPDHAGPGEQHVVGDYYAHGITARSRSGPTTT